MLFRCGAAAAARTGRAEAALRAASRKTAVPVGPAATGGAPVVGVGTAAEGVSTNATAVPTTIEAQGVGLRPVAIVQEESAARVRRAAATPALARPVRLRRAAARLPSEVAVPLAPSRAALPRDGTGGASDAAVPRVAVVGAATDTVAASLVPSWAPDVLTATVAVGVHVVRAEHVVVALNTKVGVAVRGPSAAVRTSSGAGACAATAPGDGAAAVRTFAAPATGLVPLVAVSVLPSSSGLPVVGATVPLLVGAGVRPLLAGAVAGLLVVPPAGDARAP